MDPRLIARRLVSQNKRRLQDGKYDLDLSYITEDIIAMGLPSSGLEAQYRNAMEDVVNFLEEHHKGKYKVFNLCSEKLYDPEKFGGFLACFPFDDHNCPALEMIPRFCASAKEWLLSGMENVVVVHCKAGKSRTGLMISCLLLHLGYHKTPEEARGLFNVKRTKDGNGLVLASQIRYLYYFYHIWRHGLPTQPAKRQVKSIVIENGSPHWSAISVRVMRQDGYLFPLTDAGEPTDLEMKKSGSLFQVELKQNPLVVDGDVRLQFRGPSRVLFHSWFHSSFVGSPWRLTGDTVDKLKDKQTCSSLTLTVLFDDIPDDSDVVDIGVKVALPGEVLLQQQEAVKQEETTQQETTQQDTTQQDTTQQDTTQLEQGTRQQEEGQQQETATKETTTSE